MAEGDQMVRNLQIENHLVENEDEVPVKKKEPEFKELLNDIFWPQMDCEIRECPFQYDSSEVEQHLRDLHI